MFTVFKLNTLNRVANSVTHMLEIFRNELGMERNGTPVNPSLPECDALEVGAAHQATQRRVP